MQDALLIERWRGLAYLLPCLATILATSLASAMGVSWDLHDCLIAVLVAGLPLGLGLLLAAFRQAPAVSGILSILGLTLSLMLIGAAIALLGTRSPAPIADPWLAAADRTLPLSAMDIIKSANRMPGWAIWAFRTVYSQTGLYLFATLIALHLTDRGSLAWRMFLIWGWSFLAISLIAFAAPALGCFSQLSADDVSHLPRGAGRYAVRAFNEFRHETNPTLSFNRISGVITVPSFHTVCALLVAQAWHGTRVVGPLTKLLSGAIIFSCVPMGGHYLVDLLAGAAVWWAVTAAVDRLAEPRAKTKTGAITASAAA
jgi:hypothetical protein